MDCICLVQLTTDQVMPQINQESIVRAYFTEMGRFRMKFYLSFSFLSLCSYSSSIYYTIPFFLSLAATFFKSVFDFALCFSLFHLSFQPSIFQLSIPFRYLLIVSHLCAFEREKGFLPALPPIILLLSKV